MLCLGVIPHAPVEEDRECLLRIEFSDVSYHIKYRGWRSEHGCTDRADPAMILPLLAACPERRERGDEGRSKPVQNRTASPSVVVHLLLPTSGDGLLSLT
jgi:hypothetical protein